MRLAQSNSLQRPVVLSEMSSGQKEKIIYHSRDFGY